MTSLITARPVYDPAVSQGEVCPWAGLATVQRAVSGMSKLDACNHLAREFPERSRRWYSRNLARLMRMSPADFAAELAPDPTGRVAVRRADAAFGGGAR